MATRQPSEHEDRDLRKQDEVKPGETAPGTDAPDPANDPYGDKRRGDTDKNRLPSSALTPQEKHDRDIEDLKKAGHDFKGPKVDKDPDADPEDPQLRQVTVEDKHRTRRDDGLDVPQPPPRSPMVDPRHPLHHLRDA